MSVEEITHCRSSTWFLDQIEEIIAAKAKSLPVASTRWTPHACAS
jgi:hypothetical protein